MMHETTVDPQVEVRARSRRIGRRPTYLIVLSSTSQLYSGTGTALFDWIRYAQDAFEFTILIDVGDARNFGIVRRFCEQHHIRLIPSPPLPQAGCPDLGVADVGFVLERGHWDYIECVSWANSATNLAVLAGKPAGSTLLFTPHTQPLDTLQNTEQQGSVTPIFERMLRESDAIFIDSRDELRPYERSVGPVDRAHHVRLGVNDEVFGYATVDLRHQILCLGDFAEPRKRIDLVFGAFAHCLREEPGLTLAIAGDRSLKLSVPKGIAGSLERHGYVELATLVRLYRESKALLQLSDFEAFGFPIAEALCCGTPVVIPDQDVMRDVFDGLPGVCFVEREAPADVAAGVARVPTDPDERRIIAQRASERFSFDNTYGRKLKIVKALRESS